MSLKKTMKRGRSRSLQCLQWKRFWNFLKFPEISETCSFSQFCHYNVNTFEIFGNFHEIYTWKFRKLNYFFEIMEISQHLLGRLFSKMVSHLTVLGGIFETKFQGWFFLFRRNFKGISFVKLKVSSIFAENGGKSN